MSELANNNPSPDQARVVEVAEENFGREVLEALQPALVEFGAPWSRPCQLIEAVLQDIAATGTGKVKVVKVNVDDNFDLSLWYDIQSIPTLLFFLKGSPCVRIVGTASKDAILARLKPFAAPV